MAEEKKRFPWWLVGGAALLVLAAVLGFIETVGRRGTIAGRSELIENGMPHAETFRVLGQPFLPGVRLQDGRAWETWIEGPALVTVDFDLHDRVCGKFVDVTPRGRDRADHFSWWVRRWAEDVYTVIHGPRR